MFNLFGEFRNYFQFKRSFIDNSTFRLHYRTTFAILIVASLLTTANQYIGTKIECIVDGVPTGIMNTYCWIHGTFTVPSQLTGRVGVDVAHPGVAPPVSSRDYNDNDRANINLVRVTEEGDEIRHAWYQWVCFVLFFQAIMCYIPHYLWKCWEGGKLTLIIQGLNKEYLQAPGSVEHEKTNVVNYFIRNIRKHNLYAFKFVLCEVLNLVNALVQVYFMDIFLGGQFTTYGTEVLAISELPIEERVDPLSKVFPKVTKCTFHKYGPSGTVENKDGLCVLANNIVNEKIYIFLWFWFITLIVWTTFHLLFRLVSIASKYSRLQLLCNRCGANNKSDVAVIMRKCHYGDFFLLMQMAKHINPNVFHDIIIELRDRMDQKRADNAES